MKTLVEDCFALSTKLLRNDLRKARENKPVEETFLNFTHNGNATVLFYFLEYDFNGNAYLIINYTGEPQKILLSHHQLTYGLRTYLTCGCGARVNTLYLKNTFFACFDCHNLRYKSTTINSRSDHGRMLYLQNKRLRLIEMRESIPRPLYGSKWTKRFKRFLKLCGQAGLFNQVKDAQTTMETIKAFQSQ
ncbi:MAG: hypothetical protein WC822_02185 [Candidatus Paceibacterota bacterium]|jgi:hypothetical protein